MKNCLIQVIGRKHKPLTNILHCANGDIPATVYPNMTNMNPANMDDIIMQRDVLCKDEKCNLSRGQGLQHEVSD